MTEKKAASLRFRQGGDILSKWHFRPCTVCFPGLWLPSESSFVHSVHL